MEIFKETVYKYRTADGEVFDITDSDARITSLRTYLVASVMEFQPKRMNLTTIGYNRNIFKFEKGTK